MKNPVEAFRKAEQLVLLAVTAILLSGGLAWMKILTLYPDARTFAPPFFLLLGLFLWLVQDVRGLYVPRLASIWAFAACLWGLVVFSAPGYIVRESDGSFLGALSIEEKLFALGCLCFFVAHLWLKAFTQDESASPLEAAETVEERPEEEIVIIADATPEQESFVGAVVRHACRRAQSLREKTENGWQSKLVFA